MTPQNYAGMLDNWNTIRRKGDCRIMSDKIIENNQVTIMGEIASPFFFSHEVYGEGFYMVDVHVKRLSNSEDNIPSDDIGAADWRDTGLYGRIHYGERAVPVL